MIKLIRNLLLVPFLSALLVVNVSIMIFLSIVETISAAVLVAINRDEDDL